MKKIYQIITKIILSSFSIFLFNIMISPLNIVIPINLFTILFSTIFGVMSLPFFAILLLFFI